MTFSGFFVMMMQFIWMNIGVFIGIVALVGVALFFAEHVVGFTKYIISSLKGR